MNSSSSTMSFVLSQKGKPLLVMDDYVFRLNKITNTTKYYRCENRDCTATAHTDLNNVLLKVNANHSHVIEPEKKEIRIFKQIVKERATKESTPIPKIYEEESAKMILKFSTIAILPSQREMSSSLNKARRLETPPIPDSSIFGILYLYTRTIENEEFLCVDKFIKRKTRILLFASNEHLKMLFQNSIVLMDGIFSTCPKIFDQVFTIHSIKYEQSFICGIGLLPDRKKSTYRFVFEELKGLAVRMNLVFSPSTIITDFEHSLADAIISEFPSSNQYGCYFHFTEAVYRQIQHLGLSSGYCSDGSFHNRLNLRVAKHHPNIWILIRCIQGEEIRFNHVLIQMIGGLTCRTKTAATNAIQQRIDTLYLRYQNNEITVDELLLGLSYVVAKNTSAKRKK
ncbi:unnamed protein product [Rotaria socialis]|uniref:MULE transposase domain-containing protein n=1 Tax=Rotaria socialis TaxID=392032 RepID=A0A821AZD4_9BILA|nr:unnamed protein product [Rotaria socialis]CAF4585215.1 unnamed protein product [Rotaria socialis]